MKVTTKFEINDLVERKMDRQVNGYNLFEIMEVVVQICYTTTQVFYLCRPFQIIKQFKSPYKGEGEFDWSVSHAVGSTDNSTGWKKYREDEFVKLNKEALKVLQELGAVN